MRSTLVHVLWIVARSAVMHIPCAMGFYWLTPLDQTLVYRLWTYTCSRVSYMDKYMYRRSSLFVAYLLNCQNRSALGLTISYISHKQTFLPNLPRLLCTMPSSSLIQSLFDQIVTIPVGKSDTIITVDGNITHGRLWFGINQAMITAGTEDAKAVYVMYLSTSENYGFVSCQWFQTLDSTDTMRLTARFTAIRSGVPQAGATPRIELVRIFISAGVAVVPRRLFKAGPIVLV